PRRESGGRPLPPLRTSTLVTGVIAIAPSSTHVMLTRTVSIPHGVVLLSRRLTLASLEHSEHGPRADLVRLRGVRVLCITLYVERVRPRSSSASRHHSARSPDNHVRAAIELLLR